MPPKTVALIAAGCLTTGWLLASLLTPPVATSQALPARRAAPVPPQVEEPLSIPEFQLRVRHTPEAPTTRRNPFVFGARRASSDPLVRSSAAPPPTPDETPALPAAVGPIYSLVGLGVATTAEGSTRTAIVTEGANVHVVKAGDALGVYTVREITETTVFLVDAAGGLTSLRLTQ